ncbi:group II intron maturase-specific domain-containing protein [Streptomyces sp. NPDC006700]|uniref:group II intron maturase-specific domain-containing protein n=1 Tax=Streptomyces sp. NPDC006700 TaxID=3154479 RepID=UPI0034113AB6
MSPVLANLFLHYAFDAWMVREYPGCSFERDADDAVVHCRTLAEAERVLAALRSRMAEVGLELHPDKTRIVYCRDDNRRGRFPVTDFTFLGFTFRPRGAKDKHGVMFTAFLPAISTQAQMLNPVIRGWMNYYGRFYRSALYPLLDRINTYLLRWIQKKYQVGMKQALRRLAQGHALRPKYFAHWTWAAPAGSRPRTTRAV